MEAQALAQLRTAPDIAGEASLSAAFAEHLKETERHEQLVRARLDARGAKPSAIKDAGMRLGAWKRGGFFAAHPDTPGKLVVLADRIKGAFDEALDAALDAQGMR
ncbi:MAG TPA: DUF892 family protein [Baekduia sp.]|nr:DUF892 family protein [Baekduia sp.]